MNRLIIGLGLNLNVAPDLVTASSVFEQTGIILDPMMIARTYGVNLMAMIANLTHNRTNSTTKNILHHKNPELNNLNLLGYQENLVTKNMVNEQFNKFLAYKDEVIEMSVENTRFFGKIKYAHPNGTLEVETENGSKFYSECKIVLTNSY